MTAKPADSAKPRSAEAGEVERLKAELARQQKIGEAAYALHTSLDLDDLLGLILKAAREGVDADRGTVYLLSTDGRELWSRVLSGADRLTIRLPVGKGLAGAVAADGRTIRLDDVYADARFDRSWDAKTGFRTRTMLAAPIRNREGKVDVSDQWARFFEVRPVRVGLVSLERAEILEGVSDGQRIALDDPTRVPAREED